MATGKNTVSGPATRTEQVASFHGDRWSISSLSPRVSEALHRDDEPDVYRFGKARAGRLLDGVIHDGFPARGAVQ